VGLTLGPIGGAAALVGFLDATSARGLPPRLFGGVLFIAGSLALVSALSAAVGGMPRRWLGWIGGGALLLISLGLLVGSLVRESDLGYADSRLNTIARVVSIALGVGLLTLGRPSVPTGLIGSGQNPNRTQWDIAKDVLTLAGVITLSTTVAGFWYTNIYQPSSAGTLLNITTKLEAVSPRPPDRQPLHAAITVTNKSKARVRVLASTYNVVLESSGQGYDRIRAGCVLARDPNSGDVSWSAWSATLGRTQPRVLSAGRLLPEGTWLEPEEVLSLGLEAEVGPYAQGVARLSVQLQVARGDTTALVPSWSPGPTLGPVLGGANGAPQVPSTQGSAPTTPSLPNGNGSGAGAANSSPSQNPGTAPHTGEPSNGPPARVPPPPAPPANVGSTCADIPDVDVTGASTWPVVEESLFNRLTRDPFEIDYVWTIDQFGRVEAQPMFGQDGVLRDPETINRLEPMLVGVYGLESATSVDELAISAAPTPTPAPTATPSPKSSSPETTNPYTTPAQP